MDKNFNDLFETVIFIKENMVTKDDLAETEKRWDEKFARLEKKMDDGFLGVTNRTGGLDNRIDGETFARRDLESRVRVVLPNLPQAMEQV